MKNKIFALNRLDQKIKELKNNKKIVLCHGVFDLLHIGHVKHLNFAKKFGEILIVSLTQDKFINKGLGRPVFNQELRAEMISSLDVVDYVVINNNESAVDIINLIKPNFYCKGIEYKDSNNDLTKKIKIEIQTLKKNGGKVIYSNEETYSSSKIINNNFNIYNKKQSKFIEKVKKNFSIKRVIQAFEKISKLKVLIIGELILDQYIFSETIGKSAKDTMLVVKETESKMYVGGGGSITKNISNFITKKKNISLLSYLGEKKEYLNEVNKFLGKEIKKFFIYKSNSPTIVKKRFIDKINNSKMLGVYSFSESEISSKEENKVINYLDKNLKNFDLVVVNDFSHGLITQKIAKKISKNSNFLSVNSQVNSSNLGFHSIKNFNKLNCLSINERELRHELRDRQSDIKKLIKILAKNKNFKNILVTRGSEGVLLYSKVKNKFYTCEAFANNVVDKIGAGDTIHALFSLCLRCNVDLDMALLISSLAAAENIRSYANENLIYPNKILKVISHMLK